MLVVKLKGKVYPITDKQIQNLPEFSIWEKTHKEKVLNQNKKIASVILKHRKKVIEFLTMDKKALLKIADEKQTIDYSGVGLFKTKNTPYKTRF